MWTKRRVVQDLLQGRALQTARPDAEAFAPTNIALIKYWGKRDGVLNLPVTSSVSIALPSRGAWTRIRELPGCAQDEITLNGSPVEATASFAQRLSAHLDLFRPNKHTGYGVSTTINIPVAAGVASSACGFAALTFALDRLYGWGCSKSELSILARLGSGSACRSLWNGWVEWQCGDQADGRDSFAVPLAVRPWPELRIGLLLLNTGEKSLGSREAMQRTVETSPLFSDWPQQVERDLPQLKHALATQDFTLLGTVAEANADAMHACMRSARPAIEYSGASTQAAQATVRRLRQAGVPVFYTQDAGPNLKLLFLAEHAAEVQEAFASLDIVHPFKQEEFA